VLRPVSATMAVEELRRTGVLADACVGGALSLRALAAGDLVDFALRFSNCDLSALNGDCVEFGQVVQLRDCRIGPASFFAAYFFAGLEIQRCRFTDRVDFQCGGHNRRDASVDLNAVDFDSFVKFLDCWYMGPVRIAQCKFRKGTNLLGNKGQPFEVRFDVLPEILGNQGDLSQDGEGAA